jgi:hypothetical protein
MVIYIKDNNHVIFYQSRNRILTESSDNCGFYNHMNKIPISIINQFVKSIQATYSNKNNDTIVVYGEWCGSNIQSKVALVNLPKMFVIFSIKINDIWQDITPPLNEYNIYDINRIKSYTLKLDLQNLNLVTNELKQITDSIEKECPWAKSFGFTGTGEGCVWRIINNSKYNDSKYWFKVKGDEHTTSNVTTLKEKSLT